MLPQTFLKLRYLWHSAIRGFPTASHSRGYEDLLSELRRDSAAVWRIRQTAGCMRSERKRAFLSHREQADWVQRMLQLPLAFRHCGADFRRSARLDYRVPPFFVLSDRRADSVIAGLTLRENSDATKHPDARHNDRPATVSQQIAPVICTPRAECADANPARPSSSMACISLTAGPVRDEPKGEVPGRRRLTSDYAMAWHPDRPRAGPQYVAAGRKRA
jgi:hypothetical protein